VPAARKRDDIRKEDMALLDYSDNDKADDGNIVVPDHLVDRAALARIKQETEAGAYEIPSIDVPDDEGEEEDVAASSRASTPNGTLSRSAAASPSKPAAPANSFFSFVQKWTGQKVGEARGLLLGLQLLAHRESGLRHYLIGLCVALNGGGLGPGDGSHAGDAGDEERRVGHCRQALPVGGSQSHRKEARHL